MNLQHFNYNGATIQRREDGFINLTQMCQANGKQINDFFRLKSTKEYLIALESETGIPVNQLQQVFQGSGSFGGGSWGHPLVALRLAQWISPKFAVWCDAHIFNLMASGKTSLDVDPFAEMKLKIELAKLEAVKAQAEQKTIELRHYVVTALPKPVGDRVLGVTEVKEIEYRDRVLVEDDLIRDGSTMTKKQLCDRYGFKTRNGKPDYTRLNTFLSRAQLPSEAWKLSAQILENQEFNRDYIGLLDERYRDGDRQMFLGE
jgi:hypothetical protein